MTVYEIGPITVEAGQLMVFYRGQPVALGPKTVLTLLTLIERPGETIAKTVLMDRIWPEGFVEEGNLSQNIHVLRKTFKNFGLPDPIETLPRRGYRFVLPVSERHQTAMHIPPQRRKPVPRFRAAVLCAIILLAGLVLVESSVTGKGGPVFGSAAAANSERLYALGQYYWGLRTRDGVRRSLDYFTLMLDTAPGDARGYAGLALANISMGDYCYGTHHPAVYYARASAYVKQALVLDPQSVPAHTAEGLIALAQGRTDEAAEDLRRVSALDSSYAPAREGYGIALLQQGRLPEAVTELRAANQLDPLSVATTAWLGIAAYRAGKYTDAIAYAREALELSPQRKDALVTMGRAFQATGERGKSITAFKQYAAENPFLQAHLHHSSSLYF